MNDVCVSNPDLNRDYPLEAIRVPTLVIHAVDDPMPPFAGAEEMARRIPGARFVCIEAGGHLLLGHHAGVRAEIAAFVAQHGTASRADERQGVAQPAASSGAKVIAAGA
jgi:pimeloyl-ACP methyl ester carboxylesterase